MSRALIPGLVLALALALALRCPDLGLRPMHNDEAVNAIKFRSLQEHGAYAYDPAEHHGPALAYFTLLWTKLTGAPDFEHLTEARLRMVAVLFGVGLILLLPLVADGLGRDATLCAAALTAISPAMVFYSRYCIHEMLLVFFTFLALAASWRYLRSRRLGWALLTGAAVGLMQCTKETFVFTLVAAVLAIFAAAQKRSNMFPVGRVPSPGDPSVVGRVPPPGAGSALQPGHEIYRPKFRPLLAAAAVWLLVVIVFFTSFFTHSSGPLDAIKTYLPWFQRAAGNSPHIHPWYFYFHRLTFFHVSSGPIWSEGLILTLAAIGFIAAWKTSAPPGERARPGGSSPSPPRSGGEGRGEVERLIGQVPAAGVGSGAEAQDKSQQSSSSPSLPRSGGEGRGPRFAKRSSLVGEPSRGGLGKPLEAPLIEQVPAAGVGRGAEAHDRAQAVGSSPSPPRSGGEGWGEVAQSLASPSTAGSGRGGFSSPDSPAAHPGFLRFLAVYTAALTLIYCAVPYKTPWCLLEFWHPMILLAGVGAVAIVRWMPRPQLKAVVALVLIAAAIQLAAQARRASFAWCSDPRNPYVYAQTSPDLLELVRDLEGIAASQPQGRHLLVKVISPGSDYWPLPWYLRSFDHVGWWDQLPADPFAPVMIVSSSLHAGLDADKSHIMTRIYQLRPDSFLELYAQSNVWRAYVASKPGSGDESP